MKKMFSKKMLSLVALTLALTACAQTPKPVATTAAETTPAAPGKLTPGQEYMVLVNHPNLLTILDLSKNSVYKTCTLPSEGFGPGITAMSPDNSRVYVLSNRFQTIYGVEVDTCKLIFQADATQSPDESATSVFSLAVSADGKEVYTIHSPIALHQVSYEVKPPRFAVYDALAGMDAKPQRTFTVPRQISVLMTAADGGVYAVGNDVYKIDVKNGKYSTVLPVMHWQRPGYGQPDVLNAWTTKTALNEMIFLYTAAKFKDEKKDINTADWKWGFMSVDLQTGKSTVSDFAPLEEVYFTGVRSPQDPNHIFVVLNVLKKYDIKEQKLIAKQDLPHAYYQVNTNKDGSRLYLAGTLHDVGVYDANTLKHITTIPVPGGDMANQTAQIFVR